MGLGAGCQYQSTFNLALAAGTLTTTIDKMVPARATVRHTADGANFYRPSVSPQRHVTQVAVTFSSAASQLVTISLVDQAGVARVISSFTTVGATAYYWESNHDFGFGALQNIKVDVGFVGIPAITGTITVFTEEQ